MASVREIQYGFQWGPAAVTRMLSDAKAGVYVQIKGKRGQVVVRVTPGGYVQVQKVKGNIISPGEPLKRRAPDAHK